MKKSTFLLFVLSIFCHTLSSQDIQSSTSGFVLSGSMAYSGWNTDSFFLGELAETEPAGIGYKLTVGYGINERLSISIAHQDLFYNRNYDWQSFKLSQQAILVKFSFGATLSKFRPFLETGINNTTQTIDPVSFDNYDEYELKNSGLGFSIAGGSDYFITTAIAIHLQAEIVGGTFSNISLSGLSYDPGEDVDFGMFNLNLGVRYYFD